MTRITINVYATESMGFSDNFLDRNNVVEIEVARDVVFDYYKLDNSNATEEEFREWLKKLDKFSCDETVGLWDYAKQHGGDPKIDGVYGFVSRKF